MSVTISPVVCRSYHVLLCLFVCLRIVMSNILLLLLFICLAFWVVLFVLLLLVLFLMHPILPVSLDFSFLISPLSNVYWKKKLDKVLFDCFIFIYAVFIITDLQRYREDISSYLQFWYICIFYTCIKIIFYNTHLIHVLLAFIYNTWTFNHKMRLITHMHIIC